MIFGNPKKKIEARAIVKTIYNSKGLDGLLEMFNCVDNRVVLAETIYDSLTIETYYDFVKTAIEKDYILARQYLFSIMKDVNLINFVGEEIDSDELVAESLASHTITQNIVEYVDMLNSSLAAYYWKRVSYYGCLGLDVNLIEYCAKKTVENDNYETSINLAWCYWERMPAGVETVLSVLESIKISDEIFEMNKYRSWEHVIQKMIKKMQRLMEEQFDRIVALEEKYMFLLTRSNEFRPYYTYLKMSNNPEYAGKLINKKLHSNSKFDSVSYNMLLGYKLVPGTQRDGFIDIMRLEQWYEYAKHLQDERIKMEMYEMLGKTLVYAPTNDDGIIKQTEIVDFIEEIAEATILRYFEIEAFNSIGVIDVSPSSNELEEKVLFYKKLVFLYEGEGNIKLANVFRNISDSLELRFDV